MTGPRDGEHQRTVRGPGPRRSVADGSPAVPRTTPTARPRSRLAGCSPSCSAGIVARTSRPGGIPPPDGPHAGAARRKIRPVGLLEPVEAGRRRPKGKAGLALPPPATGLRPRPGEVYDPALKARDSGASLRLEDRRARRDRRRRADRRPARDRRQPAPHPAAIVPLDIYRTTGQRAALEALGRGSRITGSTPTDPTARSATSHRAPAADADASRRTAPAGGRDRPRCRAPLALELDRTCSPIQGPPGRARRTAARG